MPFTKTLKRNNPAILLHLGFLVLYALAYHYRFERAQYECADELFYIANTGGLYFVEQGRYIAALWQSVLAFMVHIDVPWTKLFVTHSVVHIGLAHLAATACLSMRDLRNAFLVMLIPVCGLEFSFLMFPYAELLYGFMVALLADSLHQNLGRSRVKKGLWFILVIGVFTSHPLSVFFFLSTMVMRYESRPAIVTAWQLVGVTITYALFCWAFVPRVWETILNIFSLVPKEIKQAAEWPKLELWALPEEIGLALVTTLTLLLVYERKWTRVISLLALVLIGTVMVNTPGGNMVMLYVGLVSLLISLCVLDYLKHKKAQTPMVIAASLIFIVHCFMVVKNDNAFVNRKELIQTLVQETANASGTKHLITDKMLSRVLDVDRHEFLLLGSIRQESIMYSSLMGQTQSIVLARNIFYLDPLKQLKVSGNQYPVTKKMLEKCPEMELGVVICDQHLNKKYFNLSDSDEYLEHEPKLVGWTGY